MQIFYRALFWFSIALAWAIAEIELEGKYGWSEKSQTWFRTGNHHPKSLFLKVIMVGKPLTGYHLPIFFIAVMVSHIHFIMGIPWSIPGELMAIALFESWAPLWDNLWLFFNPNFNFGNLQSEIWWYKKWVLGIFPVENVMQWIVSLVIAFIASKIGGDSNIFVSQIFFLLYLLLFLVAATIYLSPIYKSWYFKMREHDDRDKVEK